MNIESRSAIGPTPGLMRRMASFLYEGVLLFGVSLIPGVLGALYNAITKRPPSPEEDAALRMVAFAIYAIYFVGFWSRRGQTLPMQTWHIKVVTSHGQPLSRGRALLRFVASCAWFAPAALIAVLNGWSRWHALGAIGIGVVAYAALTLLRRDRQFWHDTVSGTRLIDVRPERFAPAAKG